MQIAIPCFVMYTYIYSIQPYFRIYIKRVLNGRGFDMIILASQAINFIIFTNIK